MKNLSESIRSCRRAGVPLVGIGTADPAGVSRAVLVACNGKADITPVIQWDIIRGAVGVNQAGSDWVQSICNGQDSRIVTGNPAEFVSLLPGLPESSVVILLGASKVLSDPQAGFPFGQGVWNCRDILKGLGSMIVLVGSIGWKLPVDLSGDVVYFSESLPDDSVLGEIAKGLIESAKLPALSTDDLGKVIDSVSGLCAFSAEQALALSLGKDGVNFGSLWDRKCSAIENIKGLSVVRNGARFEDLKGLDAVTEDIRQTVNGNPRVRVIVFVDEIEKAMGGATGGDLSGVKQDMLGALLTWWEDNQVAGYLLCGHPGTGKTAIAESAGACGGIPTLRLDFAGTQSSLVGESGANLRLVLATASAMAGGIPGSILVIATCNSLAGLPPELRRRFYLGQYFVDLPMSSDLESIWRIWLSKTGFPVDSAIPACDGWTVAEIKACCMKAKRQKLSLEIAASRIIPVSKSSASLVEQRRKEASGCLLSASTPGVYRYEVQAQAVPGVARKVTY